MTSSFNLAGPGRLEPAGLHEARAEPAVVSVTGTMLASTSKQVVRRTFSTCSACRAGQPFRRGGAASPETSSTTPTIHQSLSAIVEKVTQDLGNIEQSLPSTSLLSGLRPESVSSPGSLTPHHLLLPEMSRPRPDVTKAFPLGPPRAKRLDDPFIRHGIDPRESPMNPYLRSAFTTSMGMIKPRGKTQLQRGSQRKMAKAVRRARNMGIIPSFGISLPGR